MKRLIVIAWISCLIMGLDVKSKAQKIQAKTVLDSTQILIGDQVSLRLELDQPKSLTIDFPVIGDSISPTVEIIERSPLDTFELDEAEQIKIIQNFTITSFDTGLQVIPPFYFKLQYDELSDTIETRPVDFFVHSMPIDTTRGPVDIKKPHRAPITLAEVSPYILGVILVGALVFFIFYYIKRKKNNKPVFGRPSKPKEPAHIIALRRLDHVKNDKLWQHGEVKLFYSEVADTLRAYIEDRFEIFAMEYTTDETIEAFTRQKGLISDKSFEELKNLLNLSDLVKFAKYKPTDDDHNLTLMNAYFFVNQTKIEDKKTDQPADDREGEEVALK